MDPVGVNAGADPVSVTVIVQIVDGAVTPSCVQEILVAVGRNVAGGVTINDVTPLLGACVVSPG
jgi:hypothetical protein